MNLSKEELAFRDEVRAFLAAELTDEIRLGGHRTSGIFSDYEVGIPWQRIWPSAAGLRPTGPSSGAAAAGRPGNTNFLPACGQRPMPPRSRPWAW